MIERSIQMFQGSSKQFRRMVELADTYAASPWPVLLLGETGVGKELFARRIHEKSDRRNGPFIPVNCGALPTGLFESELFGHERGSFSGAQQANRGLIRSAHGGTLFLDEIGDLEPALQVKLLRLLDSGEVRAVGANRSDYLDVRVVAATNVDLVAAVRNRKFRGDLMERLSVLTIRIPSLRERSEDILALASHLLGRLGTEHRIEELVMLRSFYWPGNVRQLRNFLIRASVQGRGKIDANILKALLVEESESLSSQASKDPATEMNEGSLAEIERRAIVDRLRRCHGNRKQAARELGIAKSTLHEKLRRWKLETSPEIDEVGGEAWISTEERPSGGGAQLAF